jgi:hypothetical protein
VVKGLFLPSNNIFNVGKGWWDMFVASQRVCGVVL